MGLLNGSPFLFFNQVNIFTMQKNDIHPNLFKELLDYAVCKEMEIIIDGHPYEWDIWSEFGILKSSTSPDDVCTYIHLEELSDIQKGYDGRSITFIEGDGIEHTMVIKERKKTSELLHILLSCF